MAARRRAAWLDLANSLLAAVISFGDAASYARLTQSCSALRALCRRREAHPRRLRISLTSMFAHRAALWRLRIAHLHLPFLHSGVADADWVDFFASPMGAGLRSLAVDTVIDGVLLPQIAACTALVELQLPEIRLTELPTLPPTLTALGRLVLDATWARVWEFAAAGTRPALPLGKLHVLTRSFGDRLADANVARAVSPAHLRQLVWETGGAATFAPLASLTSLTALEVRHRGFGGPRAWDPRPLSALVALRSLHARITDLAALCEVVQRHGLPLRELELPAAPPLPELRHLAPLGASLTRLAFPGAPAPSPADVPPGLRSACGFARAVPQLVDLAAVSLAAIVSCVDATSFAAAARTCRVLGTVCRGAGAGPRRLRLSRDMLFGHKACLWRKTCLDALEVAPDHLANVPRVNDTHAERAVRIASVRSEWVGFLRSPCAARLRRLTLVESVGAAAPAFAACTALVELHLAAFRVVQAVWLPPMLTSFGRLVLQCAEPPEVREYGAGAAALAALPIADLVVVTRELDLAPRAREFAGVASTHLRRLVWITYREGVSFEDVASLTNLTALEVRDMSLLGEAWTVSPLSSLVSLRLLSAPVADLVGLCDVVQGREPGAGLDAVPCGRGLPLRELRLSHDFSARDLVPLAPIASQLTLLDFPGVGTLAADRLPPALRALCTRDGPQPRERRERQPAR